MAYPAVILEMTEQELLLLNEAYRNGTIKPVHYMVLALSAAGNSQRKIWQIVGEETMTRQGIGKVINTYRRDGLKGVISRSNPSGRPARYPAEKIKEIALLYHDEKAPEGMTKLQFREWLMVEHGISVPFTTIRAWIDKHKPTRRRVTLGWLPPAEGDHTPPRADADHPAEDQPVQ